MTAFPNRTIRQAGLAAAVAVAAAKGGGEVDCLVIPGSRSARSGTAE